MHRGSSRVWERESDTTIIHHNCYPVYTLYTETHSIQHRFIETYSAVVRCKRFCSKSFATFVNFDAHVRVLCFGHMSHNGCPFSILIVVLHSCFTTPYPNASHKHTHFTNSMGSGIVPKQSLTLHLNWLSIYGIIFLSIRCRILLSSICHL